MTVELSKPRNPSVVLGAMREVIDRHLNTDGGTHGYARLDELASELEHALLVQQFEASIVLRASR